MSIILGCLTTIDLLLALSGMFFSSVLLASPSSAVTQTPLTTSFVVEHVDMDNFITSFTSPPWSIRVPMYLSVLTFLIAFYIDLNLIFYQAMQASTEASNERSSKEDRKPEVSDAKESRLTDWNPSPQLPNEFKLETSERVCSR
ncbi:hypothetical protein L210DRAFT_3641312 [Boletus edulis BED1]|uniref:Uncharacterized protein n=1 Tax=Boletus edulis BED1 TaxID=1328754 RepID=A0AAD4GJ14_BOLED|nr:hypothetical protein L210DRAFT_3641312 [Boletus edulis BED1]